MTNTKKLLVALLVLTLNVGCASRSTPEEFPAGSPLASETPMGQKWMPQELASVGAAPSPSPPANTSAAGHDGHEHSHHHHPPEQPRDEAGVSGSHERDASGSHERDASSTHEHNASDAREERAPDAREEGSAPEQDAADPGEGAYTCPMHPEVISSEPGRCPHCGMNLELKK